MILLGKKHAKPADSFPFEYYEDQIREIGHKRLGSDLEAILENPGEKPFCLILVKFGTHYDWPHNNYDYGPEDVQLQPYLVDTPETRKKRTNYYSAITGMDESVGQVLDLLKKHRLEEDTLVIWTADHGSGWPHERDMLYEAAINVPFIARWPGRIPAGSTNDALVSYVDILPTLVEVAGGDLSSLTSRIGGQKLDGRSFLPVLLGQQTKHHSEVYAAHTSNVMSVYPIRAIRTESFKYIWNIDSQFVFPNTWSNPAPAAEFVTRLPVWQSWERKAKRDAFAAQRVQAELYRPPEELYDLRSDPHEMKNLAEEPAYRDVLVSLRGKLRDWMRQQGDAGDSAYHGHEITQLVDTIYCRQPVVNARMLPVGGGGVTSSDTVQVALSCPVWPAQIRYTLDGSQPLPNSTLYSGPFTVDPPITIKAKAFWEASEGFWDAGETAVKVIDYTGIDYRFLHDYSHHKPLYYPR